MSGKFVRRIFNKVIMQLKQRVEQFSLRNFKDGNSL